MTEDTKDPPEATNDQSVSGMAAKRTRQTAQWLASSSGAVGAVLVASIGLKDVAGLSGWSLAIAGCGFFVAIAGVVAVVLSMGQVLAPVTLSLAEIEADTELLQSVEGINKAALGGFSDVKSLTETYQKALEERVSARTAIISAMQEENEAQAAAQTAAAEKLLEASAAKIRLVTPSINRTLDYASLPVVLSRWRFALKVFPIAVVATATGTLIYATQSPDTSQQESVAPTPTPVLVNLTDAGDEAFAERLGDSCDTSAMKALAVAHTGGSTMLITADEGCEVMRIAVSASEAALRSCAVEVPNSTATISAPSSTHATPATTPEPDPHRDWVC